MLRRVLRRHRSLAVFVGGVGATTSVALIVGMLVARTFQSTRSVALALILVSALVAFAGGLVVPHADPSRTQQPVRSSLRD